MYTYFMCRVAAWVLFGFQLKGKDTNFLGLFTVINVPDTAETGQGAFLFHFLYMLPSPSLSQIYIETEKMELEEGDYNSLTLGMNLERTSKEPVVSVAVVSVAIRGH